MQWSVGLANLCLRLRTEPDQYALMRPRYAAFEAGADAKDAEAVYDIETSMVGDVEGVPDRVPTLSRQSEHLFTLTNHFSFWLEIDIATRKGTAKLKRLPMDGERGQPPVGLQSLLRCLLPVALYWENAGLVLHGCGRKRAQGTEAFIGQSGAGKSTLAAMFDDDTFMGDELLALTWGQPSAGDEGLAPQLWSTPFPGTLERSAKPTRGALQGLYVLRKAQRLGAQVLGGSLVVQSLLPCVAFPEAPEDIEAELFQRLFRFISQWAKPVRTFSYHKDMHTPEQVLDYLDTLAEFAEL